jgi:ADP-ribose pyrophosphatase YjhB (NUDIX family)
MKPEVKFKSDTYKYYNRAVGIIKQNEKYLIMRVDDAPYYHLPGGHVEIGENSLDAVKREIKEELEYDVVDARLFCIQENFYEKEKFAHHGVEYYYLIEIEKNIDPVDRVVIENDRGTKKRLAIKWVTVEELTDVDLKPPSIKDLILKGNLDNLIHLINQG